MPLASISDIEKKWGVVHFKTIAGATRTSVMTTGNRIYIPHRYMRGKLILSKVAAQIHWELLLDVQSLPDEITSRVWCCSTQVAMLFDLDDWIVKKTGELKIKDLTNIYKPVEDGIMRGLGFDDSKSVRNDNTKAIKERDKPKLKSTPPFWFAYTIDLFEKRIEP